MQSLDTLPLTLPDGLSVAAVTKRLEPRSALLARGAKSLGDLPKGAEVGVPTLRDRAFVLAARRDLKVRVFTGELEDALALLSAQELGALVWPSAPFIQLGQRERVTTLLEPQQLPPHRVRGRSRSSSATTTISPVTSPTPSNTAPRSTAPAPNAPLPAR